MSSCDVQLTTKEIASLNLKCGPPFSATKRWPSSSNATVIAEPSGRPDACAAALS
jgi:hypothetical protein